MMRRGSTNVIIEQVDNGFILRLIRPTKPYEHQICEKQIVFLSIHPCLEKAKAFLEDPFKESMV